MMRLVPLTEKEEKQICSILCTSLVKNDLVSLKGKKTVGWIMGIVGRKVADAKDRVSNNSGDG